MESEERRKEMFQYELSNHQEDFHLCRFVH